MTFSKAPRLSSPLFRVQCWGLTQKSKGLDELAFGVERPTKPKLRGDLIWVVKKCDTIDWTYVVD